MRNENTSLPKKILAYVGKLPFFKIENLGILQIPPHYLKIILSRLENKKEIIRLKKGLYTSSEFIEKTKRNNEFSSFLEFLSSKIYSPSYLSLEYILYENNILTEMPQNFTLITKNKTYTFSNSLGVFLYHKIRASLFCGFKIKRINNFFIYKAEKAKALFDFLYLRKNIILNKEMVEELRLNLKNFTINDRKNFEKYIDLEGSKKMKKIYNSLFRK